MDIEKQFSHKNPPQWNKSLSAETNVPPKISPKSSLAHYLQSDEINEGTVDLFCGQTNFASDRHLPLKRNADVRRTDVRAQHVQVLDGAGVRIAGPIDDPTFWRKNICILIDTRKQVEFATQEWNLIYLLLGKQTYLGIFQALKVLV